MKRNFAAISSNLLHVQRKQGRCSMGKRELLTVEDGDQLLANAIAGDRDHPPVVKLFTPDANATWLIGEVDPDDADRLFGLCDLGVGHPELGYVSLTELSALRGPLGLAVERDEHFQPKQPLSVYADEARAKGRVVT
jgi:hypothetical protein